MNPRFYVEQPSGWSGVFIIMGTTKRETDLSGKENMYSYLVLLLQVMYKPSKWRHRRGSWIYRCGDL